MTPQQVVASQPHHSSAGSWCRGAAGRIPDEDAACTHQAAATVLASKPRHAQSSTYNTNKVHNSYLPVVHELPISCPDRYACIGSPTDSPLIQSEVSDARPMRRPRIKRTNISVAGGTTRPDASEEPPLAADPGDCRPMIGACRPPRRRFERCEVGTESPAPCVPSTASRLPRCAVLVACTALARRAFVGGNLEHRHTPCCLRQSPIQVACHRCFPRITSPAPYCQYYAHTIFVFCRPSQ